MNELFSARRFRLLFVKTILERPTQLVGASILSFSVVVLVYFLFKSIANYQIAQFFSFITGLVGGGCFLASMVFGYFSDGARSASYLTLPASSFEKWLCAILLVLLYVALFLLYFRGIDGLFVHLYHNGLNRSDPRYANMYDAVYLFSFTGDDAEPISMFFVNAAGAMLVGSLYFNKTSFIKIALVICGLYFFTFLINYVIVTAFFANVATCYPFHMVGLNNGNDFGVVALPSQINKIRDTIALYILPAILLGVSFIRLKEKEV